MIVCMQLRVTGCQVMTMGQQVTKTFTMSDGSTQVLKASPGGQGGKQQAYVADTMHANIDEDMKRIEAENPGVSTLHDLAMRSFVADFDLFDHF